MGVSADPWWRDAGALRRFVCDLTAGEMARLRPGRSPVPLPWDPAARWEDDLGADSLERLQLATALGEAIHLHRGGFDDGLLTQPTVGAWIATCAAALERYSAELTFRTSGSTGQPKWCLHSLADLQAEVALLAHLLAGSKRVVSAVPSYHIYGFLFTILMPQELGVPVVDVRPHAPARLATLLASGDAVVAYPDFWRAFVRAVPRAAPGVSGVTSTAPCPVDLADAVRTAGIARLLEIYGSSETAGIGWRDDPRRPFELFAYWERGAGDRDLMRRSVDGAARAQCAPDELDWEDARHLRPAGRAEGAVQVGGTNVFPERVAELLRRHPGVAAAAVRLMRPDEGERLKAFIVPDPPDADPAALRDSLWAWIDARLTAPERPKSIQIGPDLPAGGLGKSADWPIPPS
jgi:4-coumarate--CoA ligase (photoactive yellow protein activation family)